MENNKYFIATKDIITAFLEPHKIFKKEPFSIKRAFPKPGVITFVMLFKQFTLKGNEIYLPPCYLFD